MSLGSVSSLSDSRLSRLYHFSYSFHVSGWYLGCGRSYLNVFVTLSDFIAPTSNFQKIPGSFMDLSWTTTHLAEYLWEASRVEWFGLCRVLQRRLKDVANWPASFVGEDSKRTWVYQVKALWDHSSLVCWISLWNHLQTAACENIWLIRTTTYRCYWDLDHFNLSFAFNLLSNNMWNQYFVWDLIVYVPN